MGCHTEIVCATCKTRWDCGYGPYSGFWDRARRAPLAEHATHEIFEISEDFTSVRNGNLMIDGQFQSELLVAGYSQFEIIDVSEFPIPPNPFMRDLDVRALDET